VPIHGGSRQVQAVTRVVGSGDTLSVGALSIACLPTPCHTQDSICYPARDGASGKGAVFTGDTLFAAGCGRFFEGTGAEMHAALDKLGQLPGDTVVYNGHEYTASNAKVRAAPAHTRTLTCVPQFGLAVEPQNADLQRLATLAAENEVTAGLSTIADEHAWNVFMRLDNPAVLCVLASGAEHRRMLTARAPAGSTPGCPRARSRARSWTSSARPRTGTSVCSAPLWKPSDR
jgi:hydroxyacylglutathione hydrolase